MTSEQRRIVVYMQDWHIQRSDAFNDLLVEPLKPQLDIEVRGWDGSSPLDHSTASTSIFCQLPPPQDWLATISDKVVWIPMWDAVRWWKPYQWDRLPKSLRIVAFSEAVAHFAENAGLPTLRLKFYKDVDQFPAAQWDRRVLFYWNRTGMVNLAFLTKLCDVLAIDRLLFRPQIDPFMPESTNYLPPGRLGRTEVEVLSNVATREAYWSKVREANVFIAPRLHEGAGMTFLEALAQGCAVFAHDAPTMNAYITSGKDGFLFRRMSRLSARALSRRLRGRLAKFNLAAEPPQNASLSLAQDWDVMRALDLPALANEARKRHRLGFERWQASLDAYARFITGQT